SRALQRDLDRIEDGQRPAVVAIGEDDDALDRGQTVLARVAGKVAVRLDGDVGTPEIEHARLDVKAAARHVESQRRGRGVALGAGAERVLDDADAVAEIEQL